MARPRNVVVVDPDEVERAVADEYREMLIGARAELPRCPWGVRAIGPTWAIGDDGRWVLPERTLGWAVMGWCGVWLQRPDGEPWRFTPEQARFVLWYYALREDGRFVYRDAVLQRMKGWGKDPLAAALMAAEMLGPVRFGGWGADGEPVAVPVGDAWVQTAAVSLDQTKNTMRLFPGLFTPAAKREYRVQIGKETIYAMADSRFLQAVTRSPATLEGARASFVVLNETHLWTSSNDGHEMAAVIARNAAKSADGGARTLRITNAYQPGEDSVAERDREAWEAVQAGRAVEVGLLYDSLEAGPTAPLTAEAAPLVVSAVRGDSWWMDPERLVSEVLDVRNPPSQSRRWWYNQIVATEDAWVSRQEWDACAIPPEEAALEDGDAITLGFDGSEYDDWTALVGCRVSDGLLFTVGLWDPDAHGGEIPRAEVDAAVRAAFRRWDVVGFYADVHPWEAYIDAWDLEFGDGLAMRSTMRSAIGFDMRGRRREITEATERLHAAIVERRVPHIAEPRASQHVYNARRRPNAFGVAIGREHRESPRRIDWAVAAILAYHARRDYLALPEKKRRRRGRRRAGGGAIFV